MGGILEAIANTLLANQGAKRYEARIALCNKIKEMDDAWVIGQINKVENPEVVRHIMGCGLKPIYIDALVKRWAALENARTDG